MIADSLNEARTRGLHLRRRTSLPWLTVRGHLDPVVQRHAPDEIIDALDELHADLGGNRRVLARNRAGTLRPGLVVASTGQLVEIDGLEHFTSDRLATLSDYPHGVEFGFSIDDYRALIERWRTKANAVFTRRWSPDFDFVGGRRAQRAYFDALLDWLAPTFTGHPVLRVAVPDGDVRSAVDRLTLGLGPAA
ncbi:MAG: hypothetical protein QNJ12_07705 [Ilumatobacter sp.]|uniref:hypothetical protein n=1 Tax=Ilumatobacter sp. TaxID=1967498 RepID=UPI0026019ACD|nr:hypothetical protein [Ilumatobacter sp.]MDJ0768662.1 hypothetical protein [Ilumatobacter sp.]